MSDKDSPLYVSERQGTRGSGGDALTVAPCQSCRKIYGKEELLVLRIENFPEGLAIVGRDQFSCQDCLPAMHHRLKEEAQEIWTRHALFRFGAI